MVLKLLLRNCAASSSSESTSSRSKRLTSLYVYPGISSSFIGLQWQYNLILTAAKNKGKQLPLTRFFFYFSPIYFRLSIFHLSCELFIFDYMTMWKWIFLRCQGICAFVNLSVFNQLDYCMGGPTNLAKWIFDIGKRNWWNK